MGGVLGGVHRWFVRVVCMGGVHGCVHGCVYSGVCGGVCVVCMVYRCVHG